jgi:hypothetical protein
MKYIDSLVKKLISESLDKKADEIAEKINQKLSGEMEEEWGDYDFEYEEDELTDKAKFAKILKRAMQKKGYLKKDNPEDDIDESIVPPAEDFDYVQAEGECMEGDCGEMEEELHGNQKKIDVAEPKGKITSADFKKLRSMKEEDVEMEEGTAFTEKLKQTKKGEKFKLGNKTYTDTSDLEESYTYSITFGKDVLKLTEEELVLMIEELVLEEKGKSKGMVEYDRVHKKDSDINQKANKESFKKMKDYAKGYKGSFEENAKDFPKGSGELAKMDKKAYIPSDAVGEYVEDFAYPGQQNLTFDEIKPDDKRIKKYLEGDSTTGNSSEYANAVKTDVGKKFFKNYQDNAYGAEQKEASYKRQNQPVDIAGENKGAKTYKKTKGQKALDKLSENQLDESGITLGDLFIIKESFKEILISSLHQRPKYPNTEATNKLEKETVVPPSKNKSNKKRGKNE